MSFSVTDHPIVPRVFENHAAGAFVAFEGRVRKTNDGREVDRLDYELFPEMCVLEGDRILGEARKLFPILDVQVIHRYGQLELGESAVWVGVLAAHRGAAFQACRFIIDEVKARCPIWKKESYVDGPSEWVGCASCDHHAVPASKIFARQSKVIGNEGQKSLKSARVLMVGMGGLGCPAALNLAAAGVGYLRLVDGDRLEASNLHRQTLYGFQDIGSQKVQLAKRRLEELHPFTKIDALAERYAPDNARKLLDGIDLVIDGTDNFASKYLINDLCVAESIPYVSASIYQNQAQLFAYSPKQSSCLRCESPVQPPSACVDSCVDSGVLGAATSIVGSFQALEAVRILTGRPSTALGNQVHLDLETMENIPVRRKVNPDCPSCSGLLKDFIYDDIRLYPPAKAEMSMDELKEIAGAVWIDLREEGFNLEGLKAEQDIVLVCQRGIRSRALMEDLKEKGFSKVYSLKGGMEAVSHQY